MRRVMFFGIGALCGAIVGAALSLLNAPASGNEMRDEARTHFNEMLHEAQNAAEVRRVELEAQLADLTRTPGR